MVYSKHLRADGTWPSALGAHQSRIALAVGRQAEESGVDSAQVATATQQQTATVEEVNRTSHELARCAEALHGQAKRFQL